MLLVGKITITRSTETIDCDRCKRFACIDNTFDAQNSILPLLLVLQFTVLFRLLTVENWQQNSTRLWDCQAQIDQKLANQMNDLHQSTIWLGDRVMNLEHCLQLQCDWNTSDYHITLYKQHHWDRRHLKAWDGNWTLSTSKLKEQIFEASQTHLNTSPGSGEFDIITNNLSRLNCMKWMKSFL
ncbi:Endogenous retrovirus group K member 13-1 Env polyprotein [Plecturocebus cupreus]